MSVESALEHVLTTPRYLAVWGVVVVASLAVLVRDLRTQNQGIGPLMRFVWGFTVLYSGPIGLSVYWFSGRSQIPRDTVWRRGFRSVCHCYSGCGSGEVLGVVVAVGVLSLPLVGVVALTFTMAFTFGIALTVGPLVEEGMGLSNALSDAFYSETASIVVMEAVAIGVDVWLAGEAGIGDVLFWTALVFSLSIGLFAAYPVNVLLIHLGVKEGMMDPREMSA